MNQQGINPVPLSISEDDDIKYHPVDELPPELEPHHDDDHFGAREEGVDPIAALERNQMEMLDRMHRFGADVGNVVQNLWAEIQQSRRPAPTSVSMVSAKPPRPDTFAGGSSSGDRVDLLLFSMEQYCNAVKMQSDQRVPFAVTFLRGGAATWWRAHLELVKDRGQPMIKEWTIFTTSLIAQFKPLNWKKIARDRLHHLHQTGSVSQYIYTFHALCLDVGNISEDEKLDRFIRGLKQRVQQEVELQDPQSVETAMQIAQRIDSIQWTGRMRQQHQQPAQFNSWRNANPNQGFRVKRELNSINQNTDEESKELKAIHGKHRTAPRGPDKFTNRRALNNNSPRRLTDKERQDCFDKGLCFHCKRTGHQLWDCPFRNFKKQGKGRGQ